MLGVTLIADGRRQDSVGQDIGPNPDGQGAEITLHEVPTLSALGLTMTGPRPGGFGMLNDRTNEICASGRPDLRRARVGVQHHPAAAGRWRCSAAVAGQPVHAMYATPEFWNLDGQPATQWTLGWAQSVIDNAPHPKHG